MDKAVKKDSLKNPIKPFAPRTEPNDGAYINTLKQLQEDREKAD